MAQLCALVAVENVAYHFDILYSYVVPEELRQSCTAGSWVQVPFGKGNAQRQGIVFSVEDAQPDEKCKPVTKVLSDEPLLSESMIELALFLKDRTFCTFYDAARIQLPAGFNFRLNVTYIALENKEGKKLSGDEAAVYGFLSENPAYFSKRDVCRALSLPETTSAFEKLLSKGLIGRNYDSSKRIGNISVKMAVLRYSAEEISTNFLSITPKQQAVLDVLFDVGSCSVKELCYYSGVTSAVVSALEKKGVIELVDEDVYRIPKQFLDPVSTERVIELNADQSKAYESLLGKYRSGGGTALLYGVTGSGKTSVFLKLIDSVVESGREVIVMVPEIALTPQMMAVFKGRYGDKVAIFHSALSVGERKDEYRRVREKKAQIVVGTRSAVFAPFENLGLIVIDEEQEHTYKSESSPRYHARDIARFRALKSGALVVLSSATPSIESFSRAKKGQYLLCRLPERYGEAILPEVKIVDMKAEQRSGNYTSFSSELLSLIKKTISDGRQAVLLMNRRGYNTFVACNSCGKVITCPNCSVSLTYHSANNKLMCHYCGYSEPFRQTCSSCGERSVRYAGTGTQKIEQELEAMVPGARILRLDADAVSSRRGFETALNAFGAGEYDVLLGTQMVAKGLDFKNVTLVGVVNADTQLNDDDYRSQENTFDLMTQVVGRSGRGSEKGLALIQTINPENSVIRMSERQDYDAFYKSEIEIRRSMIYPPFCDLCVITAVSAKNSDAYVAIREFLSRIKEMCSGEYSDLKVMALPPTVPRIERINNKSRHRMIIKCKNGRRFREMISAVLTELGSSGRFRNVTFVADINPENLS